MFLFAVVVLTTAYNFKSKQLFLKEKLAKEKQYRETEKIKPNQVQLRGLASRYENATAVDPSITPPHKISLKSNVAVKKEVRKKSDEFLFYDFLKKNIGTKVEFIVNDNVKNVRQVVRLSGEDLFRSIKSNFSGDMNDEIAQRVFRDYMRNYYRKNQAFDINSLERNKIDLFDLRNFAQFGSLKAGFEFYQNSLKEK